MRSPVNVSSWHDAHYDVFEKLAVGDFLHFRILAAGPNRRGAAVGVADAEVVEIDLVCAGLGSFENECVSRHDARSIAREPDDPMLPYASAAVRIASSVCHDQ